MNVDECDGCELLSLHKQIVSRTLTRACKLALAGEFFLATDDCGRWPELNYVLEQRHSFHEHLPETLQVTSGLCGHGQYRDEGRGRSVCAIGAGFLVVVALSIGTDAVLHPARIYPAVDRRMFGAATGTVITTAGAVARWNKDLSPHWYPVALILTAFARRWIAAKIR